MSAEMLGLALAPAFFFLWFFWARDKYEREPLRLLFVTFLLGALSVLPTIALEKLGSVIIPESRNLAVTMLHYFVVVALVEESMKFLATAAKAYRSPEFDEPMDGVVYSAAAALGFAAVENVLYVFQHGVSVGIMRAILSVPGHALDSILFGYFLGLAKFDSRRKNSLIARGLLLATLFHGSWDFFLEVGLWWLAILLYIAQWVIATILMRRDLAASPFKRGATKATTLVPQDSQGAPLTSIPRAKYCGKCGAQLFEDSEYCTNCGASQTPQT